MNKIEEIIGELKTTSRSKLINSLMKIRQAIDIDNGDEKLLTYGGLPLLLSLLHKPNEKVTDLVLSILGNCCMKEKCAKEIEKLNGIRYIVHIIKNIAKDSILCRACRIVGNVSQFKSTVDHVYNYGTVSSICSLLDPTSDRIDSISVSTKLMAVRALRLLWTTTHHQHELLTHKAPKVIVFILIRHQNSWADKQEEKDLLMGIIRCLLHFTENPSHELVSQINADGTGFQNLVKLIPLHPYFIVKCITNLSTVATTRSQLETSQVAIILIERLSTFMEEDPKRIWPQDDLSALCLLCRHAATRDEVRIKNGLTLLLSVLKYSADKKQKGQVLHALLHFIYDEISLQILISEGLVSTLVTLFAEILNTMECQHGKLKLNVGNKREMQKSKRMLKFKRNLCLNKEKPSISGTKRNKENSLEDSPVNYKKRPRMDDSASPVPFDTRLSPQPSYCYSPNYTPPRSIIDDEPSDSDDSISYSPVCSDSDNDSEDDKPHLDIQVNFALDDFIHYEMGDQELENAMNEEMEPKTGEDRTIGWLLVLLSRICYLDDADPALAHNITFETLLLYMTLSSQPVTRAAKILFKIVSRWDFLMTLLQNKMVLKLHKLIQQSPHGDCCIQCTHMKLFLNVLLNKLACIAESGFGKGEIAHVLLRGEIDKQEPLIISMPYLIQSKLVLRSLFTHCHGLEMLLSVISKKNIDDWQFAVNALGLLASKLKIKDPKVNENSKTVVHNINCDYAVDLKKKKIAKFKLDDKTIIRADKQALIEHSDYFKVLLTGNFKESEQRIVRLCDVSSNGFKYFLNLLEYSATDGTSFPLCTSLPVILEVLVLTDRYLLETLRDQLSSVILKYSLSSETVAEIYQWSLKSYTDILRIESVAFGLVGKMTDQSRANIFSNIIEQGYCDQLIGDCRILLDRYLNIV